MPGFIIIGGIIEHAGHLLLMIIKQYLLITKALMTERAFLIAQLVKNPPAVQKTLVGFLGQEDPLEKG